MQEVNLVEVYIADMLGIFLILGAVFSGAWKLQKKHNEDKVLFGVIILVFTACVADIIAFSVDGRPGSIFKVLSYVSSNILFIANVAIGPLWVMLISLHIYGTISKFQRVFILSISGVILLMMVVNFFVPIIFSIDENNVYARGPWFMIKNILEVVLMADGVIIYLISLFRSGGIKFYPVLQFVWPIFICVCLQMFFYGISTIWVGIAVGYTNLMLALQNENIFIDKLTGLYNRYYLDKILGELKRKRKIAMMMLDMNGFKSINDNFGHSQGDEALVSLADILEKTVGADGTVTRFAGDEFVILLNTEKENIVEKCKAQIKENLDEFNKGSQKNYKLSASIGFGVFNLSEGSADQILKIIDKRMYEDKKAYYALKSHSRRDK
ncbi:MAG: diguanylate cyclase [Fibrobacter sp.]|uniref:GGDEF domain-containing protein n=1 Tax=Fibrobacter sp. TaxID=35828 RepID=UPI0025C33F17|nr:GGDEF domain-containing protein [Fibrobacter sp.]MBQ7080322.1 diguanylate cyclase [Fibrobacter sp.]